jgi:hypothetical protein
MDVLAPSSGPITSASRSTEMAELICGRFIVLNNLEAGRYRVRLSGTGRFCTEVTGETEVFLHSVRFVEPGGPPAHDGLFPISGQPLMGSQRRWKRTSASRKVRPAKRAWCCAEGCGRILRQDVCRYDRCEGQRKNENDELRYGETYCTLGQHRPRLRTLREHGYLHAAERNHSSN